jgi:hypothetical protein
MGKGSPLGTCKLGHLNNALPQGPPLPGRSGKTKTSAARWPHAAHPMQMAPLGDHTSYPGHPLLVFLPSTCTALLMVIYIYPILPGNG